MLRFPAVVLLLLCLWFVPRVALAQIDSISLDPNKIYKAYLIQVGIKSPDSIEFAYLPKFDQKKVEISFILDDSIANLEDISFGDDELEGPDCFIPEMKIAFYRSTYIVSFYCTQIRKYKNTGPYIASSVRMKSDVPFTQTVYDYLLALRNAKLGKAVVSEAFATKVLKPTTIETSTDEEMKELENALEFDEDNKPDDDSDVITDQFNQQLEGEEGPSKAAEVEEVDSPEDQQSDDGGN